MTDLTAEEQARIAAAQWLQIPFGAWQGTPIAEIERQRPSYISWLLTQDWFVARHPDLVNVLQLVIAQRPPRINLGDFEQDLTMFARDDLERARQAGYSKTQWVAELEELAAKLAQRSERGATEGDVGYIVAKVAKLFWPQTPDGKPAPRMGTLPHASDEDVKALVADACRATAPSGQTKTAFKQAIVARVRETLAERCEQATIVRITKIGYPDILRRWHSPSAGAKVVGTNDCSDPFLATPRPALRVIKGGR
jgi:hypothetical protein